MKGISSFRNEIEMSFIFNVNRQQTLFLRRVNVCSFLWLH